MKVEYIDGDGSEVPVVTLNQAAADLYAAASAVIFALDVLRWRPRAILGEDSAILEALRKACALAEDGDEQAGASADLAGK